MHVELIDKLRDSPLYEQVCERIRSLIVEGTLQPGDRLPSVRKLHQQLSVSISTVLEAYRLLEDQGWIGVRPQSGYFVKRSPSTAPEEPSQSALFTQHEPIEISLAYRVSATMRDSSNVRLGAAVPDVELLPTAALNRLMGQVLRSKSEQVHSVWGQSSHTYTLPSGCEALRHQVAKRLLEAGCSLNPNELIITNGTTEALALCLRAVTKPGDTVAIESPAYYGLLEILKSLYLKALEIPTHPKDGISLAHLESAIQRNRITTCVLVSNFSNPLGYCMSAQKKQQIVELFNRYDLPLNEDDIYGELSFERGRPNAIKAFDTEGRILYCASVSKTLSPGLRVGWAAPGQYQIKVEHLKMAMNWMTAIAPQLTVAAFFANGGYDRHLRKLCRAYQTQVSRMTQAICDYFPPQTKVTRPNGGFVLWLELPSTFNAMDLYEAALQHKISIAPGEMFSPCGNYRNCLRLNCGSPWSTAIDQAMQTLGSLAKELLQT